MDQIKTTSSTTKKYLAIGIIVILAVFGAFMLLNNAGNNKTDLAGGGGVPVGENDGLPIADSDSEISGPDITPFVPAGDCPEGQIMNEEKGECEPEGKIPDEIGPIGEPSGYEGVKGYLSYINHLHKYQEENNNLHAHRDWDDTWGYVDGHPLYLRVNSIEKGKKLDFSVGYIDGAKKWHEVKRFTSEKERIKKGDMGYYSYGGCFSYPDNPLYPDKACSYYLENSMKNSCGSHAENNFGFTVVENTSHGFGITGTLFYYQGTLSSKNKDDIQSFRSGVSFDPGPSISSLSD